jgi:hypothetical protein
MFPIYIISKGRSADIMPTGTTGHLSKFGIPHYIMVEPQEKDKYEQFKSPYATILTIPQSERDKDRERYCYWTEGKEEELGASMGRGAVASRNSTKRHAEQSGVRAFYNMDDNATGFFKWMTEAELNFYKCWHALQQDEKIPEPKRAYHRNLKMWGMAKVSMVKFKPEEKDKVQQIFFEDFEPNLFKIDNMGFIGFNTVDACPRCVAQYLIRPVGRRVYSCTLMKTDYPLDWWGQTSDDVLLNIDCLCEGYYQACLWRWVMGKPMTQTMKGGCTDNAYGRAEGETMKSLGAAEMKDETYAVSTYPKTKFITTMYPQYLNTKAWKRRIHHEFLWKLMPNPEIKIDENKIIMLEAVSNIDHLFPDMKIAYKKAEDTKKEMIKKIKRNPLNKFREPGFKSILMYAYEKEQEGGDPYQDYDEDEGVIE